MEPKIVFRTPESQNFFFGYFDKSQLDKSSERLLAHRVESFNKLPSKNDFAEVGYFDIDHPQRFHSLDKTFSFNWQQGSMLQWLGPNHDTHIIYNIRLDNKFRSKITDLKGQDERILDHPIYSVSHDGQQAFTIDFERHYWCRRGYSYAGIENHKKNKKIVDGDGIFTIDIPSGTSKLLVDIEELLNINPISTMANSVHYVEHVLPNTNSTRIAFLHRWIHESGIHTRLYTCSSQGDELRIINDSGRVSHFSWIDEEKLIVYGAVENTFNLARKNKFINKAIIRPLLPFYKLVFSSNSITGNSSVTSKISGDSYFICNAKNGDTKQIRSKLLDRDGHPSSPLNNSNYFITDTYPNEESVANLMFHDLEEGKTKIIDKLNSITKFDNTPLRCDLHPRCSYDGKYISIDTMDSGSRSIYVYRI